MGLIQKPKHTKDQLNMGTDRESLRKALTLTTGVGGSFGLVVTAIIASLYGFPKPVLSYFFGIPVFCALVAGFAGVFGFLVNRLLLKIGMLHELFRQIVGIIIVVSVTITSSLGVAFYLGLFHLNQLIFVITTAFIGFIFGLVVTLVEYRIWNMQQQVLSLEVKNNYLIELAEKEKQLQETTKNLIIAEERNRMARELHDSVSQGIHGIIYTLHSLRQHLGTEDWRTMELLNHLENTSEATLGELKAMIMELKPSSLEERGLAETLKNHCQLVVRNLQFTLDLKIEPVVGLTPGKEIALYRIVQEGLANIQQHAKATQAFISLVKTGNLVILSIRDNGVGFNREGVQCGNGLHNMEARCLENFGKFKISSDPDVGTTIEATFSFDE